MDTTIIFWALITYLSLVNTTCAQTCEPFPVVDLGYASHRPTVVNTTVLHNISYATYANIRFAQPPVGELRFRKPQLPPPSNSTVQDGVVPHNATNCLITIPRELEQNLGINGTTWGSEDCLFLDVKVPEGVVGGKVPVLLWFYGGGYFFGSKEPWAGDTAALFQRMAPDEKFITVASNYRIGGLGWLSPDVEGVDKNVGFYDCLATLDWVKQYISYFGGDPEDITIIGESTGGGLGAQLLAAYGGTKDMGIKKAILTSSGIHPYPNRQADFDRQWNIFLQAANCSDIDCVRALSSDAIAGVNAQLILDTGASEGWIGPGIGYGGPIPDDDAVPDVAFRLLANGQFDRNVQKVMTGGMLNDGQYLLVTSPQNWTDFLRVFMKTPTESTVQRVLQAYPGDYKTASNSFAGDAVFKCHGYFIAKGYGANAYRYEMSIPPAQHGQDQYYYWYGNGTSPTDVVVKYPAVAEQMQDYIRSFVLDDYPGGGNCDRPHWPSYGDAGRWMNITADGFQLVQQEGAATERCALLLDLMNDPANGW